MKIRNRKNNKGLSLIEILIVVSIFAVLGILTTRSVILTLRGAKKSDSQITVRENLNYSLSVIERQLRNAKEIVTCSGGASGRVDYISNEGLTTSFSCGSNGTDTYVASGSGRLTGSDIKISGCSFTCTQESINKPPIISVSFTGESVVTGSESSKVSVQSEVVLRNY